MAVLALADTTRLLGDRRLIAVELRENCQTGLAAVA
jgi:hypothetical protein